MNTLINKITKKTGAPIQYKATDFKPKGVDVRWCAGCGSISILSPTQRVMPDFGIPKENIVFISGIGCASRFPYYMDTYGFHGIHGRALAIATGLKITRPELSVWIVTGDGDNMSIGGNHFIHACRRNTDLNVMMFNNEIYGLTKGQYSPTSQKGLVTKTSPTGVLDDPFCPTSLALGSGAAFVARGIDNDRTKLQELMKRAYDHKGMSFIEIYDDCRIFNGGAFDEYTATATRDETTVWLEHGNPVVFGAKKDKGIVMDGYNPKVVSLQEGGKSINDLLIHNEQDTTLAFILSNMTFNENLPRPMGVILSIDKPSYEVSIDEDIEKIISKKGEGDLQKILFGSTNWNVN